MVTAFICMIVALLGTIIVSAVAKAKPGSTEESRSIAVGVYDLIVGIAMLIIGGLNNGDSLPKDDKALFMLLMLFGGIWAVGGVVQLVMPFIQKGLEQEIEKKIDDQVREQRRRERQMEERARGEWRCVCGRINSDEIRVCSCGRGITCEKETK